MSDSPKRDLTVFLIKVGVVTAAALGVLFVARTWFVRPQAPASDVIPWHRAARHLGEFGSVEGVVVRTHRTEKACFLNFHSDWQKTFSAVIFASRFDAFPPDPQDLYRGKKVRLTGLIKDYKGRPEMILDSPDQIEILP